MTTVNPLSNLKDIHLPPPISWWPPAPGWWILAVLIIFLSFFIVFWLLRSYERRRPKIEALKLLKDLKFQYENSQSALTTLPIIVQGPISSKCFAIVCEQLINNGPQV